MNTTTYTPGLNKSRLLAFTGALQRALSETTNGMAEPLMKAEAPCPLFPNGIPAETKDERASCLMDDLLAKVFAAFAQHLDVPDKLMDPIADYVIATMDGRPYRPTTVQVVYADMTWLKELQASKQVAQ